MLFHENISQDVDSHPSCLKSRLHGGLVILFIENDFLLNYAFDPDRMYLLKKNIWQSLLPLQ